PERVVFESLQDDHYAVLAERLGVPVGALLDAIEDAIRLDDHHTWARRVAERLSGAIRPSKVWDAALDVWARDVLPSDERFQFVELIRSKLPPIEMGDPIVEAMPEGDSN